VESWRGENFQRVLWRHGTASLVIGVDVKILKRCLPCISIHHLQSITASRYIYKDIKHISILVCSEEDVEVFLCVCV